MCGLAFTACSSAASSNVPGCAAPASLTPKRDSVASVITARSPGSATQAASRGSPEAPRNAR